MRIQIPAAATILAALIALSTPAGAVVLGQIDNFEDGTVQGWAVGLLGAPHPVPPQNVPDGGPAGAGDNFLLITAVGGLGAGSRLSVINAAGWGGDYIGAGVGAIAMDLANFGDTDLRVRLVVEDPVGRPPTNVALTGAVPLPAGSGWRSVVFALSPSDLIAVQGDAVSALTGATTLRIVHAPDPALPPPPIAAQLGVDNVMALPGPVSDERASWGAVKHDYR